MLHINHCHVVLALIVSTLIAALQVQDVAAMGPGLCTKADEPFCSAIGPDPDCAALQLSGPCPKLCGECVDVTPEPTPVPTATPIATADDVAFTTDALQESDGQWTRLLQSQGFSSGFGVTEAFNLNEDSVIGIKFTLGNAPNAKVGVVNASAADAGYDIAASQGGGVYYGFWFASFGQVVVVDKGEYKLAIPLDTSQEFAVHFNAQRKAVYTIDGEIRYTSVAATTDEHFKAMLAIQDITTTVQSVTWLYKDLWCDSVVCAGNQCQTAGECVEGTCTSPANKQNGLDCDDGDVETSNDACFDGVCVGVDLCLNVTCPVIDPCHTNPQCVLGDCIAGPSQPDGEACITVGEVGVPGACDKGLCIALTTTLAPSASPTATPTVDVPPVGFCNDRSHCPEDVVCVTPYQCSALGICEGGEQMSDGAACDDANATTVGDVCNAGTCAGVDPCADVTCSADSTCEVVQCVPVDGKLVGECETTLKSDGSSCDDGDATTFRDRCFSNVCLGLDPCTAVDCGLVTRKQCREVGVCVADRSGRPTCTEPFSTQGTSCNDGDDQTISDVCTADGDCVGVNPCVGFSCPLADQCFLEMVCVVKNGNPKCENRDQLPVGSSCDDGDATTGEDGCDASAKCVGSSLCEDVDCGPRAECYEPRSCLLGECLDAVVMDDFTDCDDSDDETEGDTCFDGICKGTHICRGVSCPPETDQCIETDGTCVVVRDGFGAPSTSCTYVNKPKGTPCDDGDDATSIDVCDNGVCQGDDLCVLHNITCPPPQPCYQETACYLGQCNYTILPDFTSCELPEGVMPVGVPNGTDLPANAALQCVVGECVLVDDCVGVLCESTDLCRHAPQCQLGHTNATRCAGVGERKPQNTICDDNNDITLYDMCQWDVVVDALNATQTDNATQGGNATQTNATQTTPPATVLEVVCRGIDLCADVVCPTPDQCHDPVVCEYPFGVCPDLPVRVNQSCDDGDFRTLDDTCNAVGECVGVDRCVGVTCEDQACVDNNGCLHGICQYNLHNDTTTCDDENESTLNDTCTGGLCFGIPSDKVCFFEADCNATGCTQEQYPDGKSCDDDWLLSYSDVCLSGTCFGQLPCPQSCVAWGTKIGVQETNKYGLVRSKAGDDWTTAAISDEVVKLPHHDGGHIAEGNASYNVGVTFRPDGASSNMVIAFVSTSTTSLKFGDSTWGVLLNYIGVMSVLGEGTFHPDNPFLTYEADDVITIRVGYSEQGETFQVVQNGLVVFATPWTTDEDDSMIAGSEYHVLVQLNGEASTVKNFEWVTAVDTCDGVTCDGVSQCREASWCFLGSCVQGEDINEAFACDDGVEATDFDTCKSGTCSGEDFCDFTVCPTPKQCESEVVCSHGECEAVLEADDTMCDDDDNRTTTDVCSAGVCSGVDLCLHITEPCPTPDVDRCLESSSCFQGVCYSGAYASGTPCDDGDATTTNDYCLGALDSCIGEKLKCTTSEDGSISFDACMNQTDLLSSSQGIAFALVEGDDVEASDACLCTTSYGQRKFQATRSMRALDAHVFSRSECARLTCTNNNFHFTTCEWNGEVAAAGDWDMTTTTTTTVSAEFEDVICEAGAAPPSSLATATPTSPSTTCPQGDCHIFLNPSAGKSQDCNVSTNQVVSWEWSNAGLNVRSDGGLFADSGDPVLQGCYQYRFEHEGVYPFHALLYPQTVFGKVFVAKAFEIVTTDANVVINWGPEELTSSQRVCVGDTVEWTWAATPEPHNVVSGYAPKVLFTSGTPAADGNLKIYFTDSGDYSIHDDAHEWMKMTLVVGHCTPPTTTAEISTTVSSTAEVTTTVAIDCSTTGVLLVDTLIAIDGSAGVGETLTSMIPRVSTTFSVIVSFTVTRSGYLFAHSNVFGHRYYSVYVNNDKGLRFYYRMHGSNAQQDARLFMDHDFTDGEHYTLLMTVHDTVVTATAVSDTRQLGSSSDKLDGTVDDCNANGRTACVFVVGARANGVGSFAYAMNGTVDALLVYPNCNASVGLLPTTPPIVYEPPKDSCFDFLEPFVGTDLRSSNLDDLLTEDGSLQFDSSSGLDMLGPAEALGKVWAVYLTFTQNVGNDGYLFAKTDKSGLKRYYAVFLRSDKLRFFYVAKETGSIGIKEFLLDGVNLQDGQPHQLTFIMFHGYAAMLIDNKRYVPTDQSPIGVEVDDCLLSSSDPDCVLKIGQRSSNLGGVQTFSGNIMYASICTLNSFPRFPVAGGFNVQHLLRHSTTPGSGAYEVLSFKKLANSFSLYFDVQSDVPDLTAYLFSKISKDLDLRYFSIYALPRELRLSYHPQGASSDVDLPLNNIPFLFDGLRHRILITVVGTKLSVYIDDLYSEVRTLQGSVEDCESDSDACQLHLGQKSNLVDGAATNYMFDGNMYRAEIYYDQVLTAFP
eukprot:m.231580 g.231580  ORF g.231580 m.231580 type:complete len:2380 (+) comp33604_c0_seq1:342-7481(+)